MNNLAVITQDIYDSRDTFAAVLTDPSINFEKEAGFAIQVLQQNEYALGVAVKNRQSVVNAVTNVAAIGISLNPAQKQAYLVPRDGRICLDISYMGLMDLAISTGSIRWGQARIVHENDHFELDGFDKEPVHKFKPFSKDRGGIVGVYVVVKTDDGDYLTETMSLDDVNAIRDRSTAWKAWVSKQKSCPWVTDWSEMAKKTVVKRASKYWPKNKRLDEAIHHLNTDGGEGIDMPEKHRADPDLLPRLRRQVEAAATAEALAQVWKDGLADVKATKDMGVYNAFKAAVQDRGAMLRGEAQRTETPPDDGNTIDEQPHRTSDPDDGFGRDDQGGTQE